MEKKNDAGKGRSSPHWVLLCRPGFENVLREEIALRLGADARDAPVEAGEGLAVLRGPLQKRVREALGTPLIFERQRLPGAVHFPHEPLHLLAGRIRAGLPSWNAGSAPPWRVQAYAANPNAPKSLAGWASRLERALGGETAVSDAAGGADGRVLQLCAVPGGVWVCLAPARELSSPLPGGVHHMPAEPGAPSRSYLKIEEALQLLGVEPRARERVIDLGAAPGGWSFAFLKRGCRVLAVDNGPMKLDAENLAGELTHLRANGMSFKPPPGWTPVDWLVSDMLVSPGQSLGLLRRWLPQGWARRIVVNIKLPQREPLAALQPIQEFLAGQHGLRFQIRQLYHDRREVTLLGETQPGGKRQKGAEGKRQRAPGGRRKG